MLDQNLTTLLAALLGGLLSIVGGFVANYYIQSSTDKIQKKKEIRNLIEQIYKSTQTIAINYKDLITGVPETDVEKKFAEIFDHIEQIELMVSLYLSPLRTNFDGYKEEVLSNMKTSEIDVYEFINAGESFGLRRRFKMPPIEDANKRFRASLAETLKQKGYSYF